MYKNLVKIVWLITLISTCDVLILRPYDKYHYRAYCAGSIIGEKRVLTSNNCFMTNQKNPHHNFTTLRLVAALLETIAQEAASDSVQQWRKIQHVYSQKYYRFPVYDLAVVVVDKPFAFNKYVNLIPYATKDFDFDGICATTAVKTVSSWSTTKDIVLETVMVIPTFSCETILCRSANYFYCTNFVEMKTDVFSETEGGGLICFKTGDPAEVNHQGLLVGVSSVINSGLPNLHTRVGVFHKWVTDSSRPVYNQIVFMRCLLMFIIIHL